MENIKVRMLLLLSLGVGFLLPAHGIRYLYEQEMSRVDKKVRGYQAGGVYSDREGNVWFVKYPTDYDFRGRIRIREDGMFLRSYIVASVLPLILGQNSVPIMRPVLSRKGERDIVGVH